MGGLIILGEGHFDDLFLADLRALQLLFKAGDEAVRPDHQIGVFGRATLEGLAVDLADEIDGQLVAVGSLDRLAGLVLVGFGLRGQFLEGLFDVGVGRFIDRAFQLERLGVDRREVGHDLERHFIGEVGTAGDDLVHVAGQLHLGRSGRAQLGVFQGLLAGLIQGGVDDLAHEVPAIGLAHVRGRHLARTEALELHLGGDFLDAGIQLFVQLSGGNDNLDHAAEAGGGLFNDLHGRSDALGRDRHRAARVGE